MVASEPTSVGRARVPDPDLVPGYQLETLIGKGGMGEVYKGVQLSLGRPVAIKLLPAELAREEAFVARFEKEAAALAALSHPNVVSIVDKGKNATTYYLVMEYVDGPSLREVMREKSLSWLETLRIVHDIGRGIDYAHSRGVIHRDLKPENILFSEQAGGVPKVTDFGLAGFVKSEGGEQRFALTETHVSMGTLAYMAPEQQGDAKGVDGRADIYSLGVMLYELLVGDVPRGNFDAPSGHKPEIDKRVDAIVARCLRSAPGDRYQTVTELLADLEPLLPRPTLAPAPLKPAQRLKLKLAQIGDVAVRVLLATLVVLAILVLALAAIRSSFKRAPEGAGWVPAAAPAAGDLPPGNIETVSGSLEATSEQRRLALGEGDEKIPVFAVGRPLDAKEGTFVFPEGEGDRSAGRASPEVADLGGDTASLSAVLAPPPAPSSRLLPQLREALFDEHPVPLSALLLQGAAHHYVAVLFPVPGEPLTLEWVLGKRRGVMLGPPAPNKDTPIELSIDRRGELRAFFGEGRERQQIGEPLRFGSEWRDLFAATPKPAIACLAGVCRFQRLIYDAQRTPDTAPTELKPVSPPALPVTPPAKVSPSKPAPVPPTRPGPKVAPVRPGSRGKPRG